MCMLYFIAYPKCRHYYLASTGTKCAYVRHNYPDRVYDPRIPTPLKLDGFCHPDEIRAVPVRLRAHRECPICLTIELAANPVDVSKLPNPGDYATGQTPGASELDNLKRRRDIPMQSRQHQISVTHTRKEWYSHSRIQFSITLQAEFNQWWLNERRDMERYGSVDETSEWRSNMSEVDNIKRRQDLPVNYRRELILHSYTIREHKQYNDKERYTWNDAQKTKDVEDWIERECKDMETNWVPILPPMDYNNPPKIESAGSKLKNVLMADPVS